ncbi:oligosaccharide flippase family protein [Ornithinimicrobium pekingense]|uniref:oligosaccharide flippase family protein n=1 Tax=Ornithinimicrobium pekingense TaxID=384677 RepID=UPI00146D252E|nr:oligosaccharide flippase family protein [Ornithinimicrobium pekingense]
MRASSLDRGFARNAGALLLGQVVRVPVVALYFVVATRSLGVESFGRLSAVLALILIVSPFASLGSGAMVVKHGATRPSSTRLWLGAGLTLSGLGAVAAGTLVLLLSPWVAPASTGLVVVLALLVAELVGARAVDLAASVFVAREEMHLTALCQVLLPAMHLVTVGALVASPAGVDLRAWVLALVVSSLTSGVVCLTLAVRAVGRPTLGLAPFCGHWREAALFSVGIGVHTAHNDLDKVMLGRLDGPAGVGLYSAAYRLVDTAWLPMRAMLGAAWPRMFRHAQQGPVELVRFAGAVARPALLYSVLVVVVMVLGAGLVVPLLGESYSDSVPLLRVLAVVVLLRCLHYLPADVLTGMGRQEVRTAVQVGVLGLNVTLNLWLIPQFGVWGAAWATLACETTLALALWTALAVALRSSRRATPTGSEAV